MRENIPVTPGKPEEYAIFDTENGEDPDEEGFCPDCRSNEREVAAERGEAEENDD